MNQERWWVYRTEEPLAGEGLGGYLYIGPRPDADNAHDWIEVEPVPSNPPMPSNPEGTIDDATAQDVIDALRLAYMAKAYKQEVRFLRSLLDTEGKG